MSLFNDLPPPTASSSKSSNQTQVSKFLSGKSEVDYCVS